MRVIGLALLMTLAAGCAGSTTPITMETGEPVPADRILQRGLTEPAPGRSAKVSVLRDSGFYGAGCTYTIDVDGNPVFAIKAGERQTVYLPPGAHELTLRIIKGLCPEYSLSRRVVLRENEEKVFRIFIASPTSGPDIVDLSQSAGEVASTARKPGCDSVSTPGYSLTLREESRTRSSSGTQVTYRLSSTGFPASGSVPLWHRHGGSCVELWAAVGADGAVKVLSQDTLLVEGYVSGQPVELALVSGENSARAKAVPFPIEASSAGYGMSVEALSDTGLLFFLSGTGFEPGEDVGVVSEYEGYRLAKRVPASPTGNVVYPLMFQKGDHGTAKASINGRNGSVSLEYGVGEDALVVR